MENEKQTLAPDTITVELEYLQELLDKASKAQELGGILSRQMMLEAELLGAAKVLEEPGFKVMKLIMDNLSRANWEVIDLLLTIKGVWERRDDDIHF